MQLAARPWPRRVGAHGTVTRLRLCHPETGSGNTTHLGGGRGGSTCGGGSSAHGCHVERVEHGPQEGGLVVVHGVVIRSVHRVRWHTFLDTHTLRAMAPDPRARVAAGWSPPKFHVVQWVCPRNLSIWRWSGTTTLAREATLRDPPPELERARVVGERGTEVVQRGAGHQRGVRVAALCQHQVGTLAVMRGGLEAAEAAVEAALGAPFARVGGPVLRADAHVLEEPQLCQDPAHQRDLVLPARRDGDGFQPAADVRGARRT